MKPERKGEGIGSHAKTADRPARALMAEKYDLGLLRQAKGREHTGDRVTTSITAHPIYRGQMFSRTLNGSSYSLSQMLSVKRSQPRPRPK